MRIFLKIFVLAGNDIVLNYLYLKRFLKPSQAVKLQLVGFSDASEMAYSAIVYLRAVCLNGEVDVNLIVSKTRVAPVRKVSLPRLELCGALLLARLVKLVRETVLFTVDDIFCVFGFHYSSFMVVIPIWSLANFRC